MKKILQIEPVAPMSAVNVEAKILAELEDKILIQNWNGEYLQLTPSSIKDDKTIYRVEDQASDICMLKFDWRKERK